MTGLQLLGLVGTVVGLIATSTAVVAFARASYAKATIAALRDDVGDRDKRITYLEAQDQRKTKALERQDGELQALRNTVSGQQAIREHEERAQERHRAMLSALGTMTDDLARMTGALQALQRAQGGGAGG